MEAEAAFAKLKLLFTTAPVLSHSDPACQFIVEVDSSDVSMGVVLSQRSVGDQKLHPCTFFSCHLNGTMMWATVTSWPWSWPSKSGVIGWRVPRSYSWFGLTIKTWPTYRALLNSRQTRWGLFFGHFAFALTYWPGSKNTKPSRQFAVNQCRSQSFHPPVSWAWPPGKWRSRCVRPCAMHLTLEELQRIRCLSLTLILWWGFGSKLSCHPGLNHTLHLLRQCFWWPSMVRAPEHSSLPVPCVPMGNLHTSLLQVS